MKKLYTAVIGLVLLTSCGKVDLSANIVETTTGAAASRTSASETTASTVTSTVTTFATLNRTTEPDTQETSSSSEKMPEMVFIRRVLANEYCPDKTSVSIIDRKGNRYYTEDKNICGLNNEDIDEKLEAGALDAYLTKADSIATDEIAENYKLLCEAVENDDCSLNEPEMMPDVEASVISVCGMYYNSDGELKSVRIYENECLTDIFTNSDKLTRVYKWYNGTCKNV